MLAALASCGWVTLEGGGCLRVWEDAKMGTSTVRDGGGMWLRAGSMGVESEAKVVQGGGVHVSSLSDDARQSSHARSLLWQSGCGGRGRRILGRRRQVAVQ